MRLISIHDKQRLAAYLLHDPVMNSLLIGDLDDFFWQSTCWYGLETEEGELVHLALLYLGVGAGLPVFLCYDLPGDHTAAFVNLLFEVLPTAIYAHLRPELASYFAIRYEFHPHGLHYKMALTDLEQVKKIDISRTQSLDISVMPLLEQLYTHAYPGNFFDPRMLETGYYYGIYEHGGLLTAAGIHVVAEEFQVAVIGNVATLPERRNYGLARQVCARVCHELLKAGIHHISLNVMTDNNAAISSYERLGFKAVGEYGEYVLRLKTNSELPEHT